jgi:hypothetical protein
MMMKKILFAPVLLAILIVLAGCQINMPAPPPPTPTLPATDTPTAVPTEPVLPTGIPVEQQEPTELPKEKVVETETPVPVMEATATPADVEVSKEVQELDKRIIDFLNGEGKYTEEALSKIPHMGFDTHKMIQGNYFGLLQIVRSNGDGSGQLNPPNMDESSGQTFSFQGIYLGGELTDSEVIFYIGMENKLRERIVVKIGLPIFPEEGDVLVNGLRGSTFDGGNFNINHVGTGLIKSKLSDFKRWERYNDTGVVFRCYGTPLLDSWIDITRDVYGDRPNVMDNLDNSIPLCRGLYNHVPDLRGRTGELDNAAGKFWYAKDNFVSIRNKDEVVKPYIFYDTILFVRR